MSKARLDALTGFEVAGVVSALFLLGPLLVIVPMSFNGGSTFDFPPKAWSVAPYVNIWRSAVWRGPLLMSLKVGSAVAVLTPLLALLAASGFQQTSPRIRPWLVVALSLPLFVPPVILGVGQLLVAAPLGLADTALVLIVGHTLLAFPVAFFLLNTALVKADLGLESAAIVLGAPWLYAAWRVTWPQVRKTAAVAAILSFVISFDEPVLALFLSSSHARTLPRQMFDSIRYDMDPTAAAIASSLVVISIAIGVSMKSRFAD